VDHFDRKSESGLRPVGPAILIYLRSFHKQSVEYIRVNRSL